MSVIILFCAMFVLQETFNVLVESLCEDLVEDPGVFNHINFTWTRELVWPTLTISTLVPPPPTYTKGTI